MDKVYLKVDYREKDDVKALGAQFDWQSKKWYVLPQEDLSRFNRWLDDKNNAIAQQVSNTEETNKSHYTIRQLKTAIQQLIQQNFSSPIWIVGEIIKIQPKHGHLYLELQDDECQDCDQKRYTLRVNIWKNRVAEIQEKLQSVTSQVLAVSQRVRLKITLDFHTQYDLSGSVSDIDPELTLGQIALAQKKIKEKLIKAGLFYKNKHLEKPVDFCRVVVIHPDNASGFHDFKHMGDKLEDVCEFHYIAARFEGQSVERDMSLAFEKALALHLTSPIDALIIIRGGGARQGLLALITESIIQSIVCFPAPVIVGVGHTEDKLLIDEAANLSCGTPSKVIEYITRTILTSADKARRDFHQIEAYCQQRLILLGAQLQQNYRAIRHTTTQQTTLRQHHLTTYWSTLETASIQYMQRIESVLTSHWHLIKLNAPKKLRVISQQVINYSSHIRGQSAADFKRHNTHLVRYWDNIVLGAKTMLNLHQGKVVRAHHAIRVEAYKQQYRIGERLKTRFSTIELLIPSMQSLEKAMTIHWNIMKRAADRQYHHFTQQVSHCSQIIYGQGLSDIKHHDNNLVRYWDRVALEAKSLIASYYNNVSRYDHEVRVGALTQRDRIKEKLDARFATIELLSPMQTLKRGYCLSIGGTGVIKSLNKAKQSQSFILRFADGEGKVIFTEEKQ
ncbi:MAG: exodeoxyribonuclease VII large subunit [Gammaproteobacteria bacterium]|nr:exodeoxyribonuclease VII large subunit [Gammaproteobacteria bacterium]